MLLLRSAHHYRLPSLRPTEEALLTWSHVALAPLLAPYGMNRWILRATAVAAGIFFSNRAQRVSPPQAHDLHFQKYIYWCSSNRRAQLCDGLMFPITSELRVRNPRNRCCCLPLPSQSSHIKKDPPNTAFNSITKQTERDRMFGSRYRVAGAVPILLYL